MTDRIFFDLDGTLIDSSRRLYILFTELVSENSFSYEDYWKIKRRGINQRDLLHNYFDYSNEQILSFQEKWREQIEDPARLEVDSPFDGVSSLLRTLSRTKKLYILTARQYPERAKSQIQKFGWQEYLTDIFVTQQMQSKAALIRAHFYCDGADIFVGDTGEDILSGKELGVKTIAVYSGGLNEELLREYHPDIVLDTVVKLEFALRC